MASALAYRDFRLLWASSLCSWSSQWIQQAALGWVVYEITGSGALLGAVLGARAIPMLLLTPLSGVAADRWDRRRLMQASQALACAVSLAFGAALAAGVVGTWMLFAFTILMGASNVMDRPARMSTAFELVPREVAMKAVALNTVGFSMMRIAGPAVAGYLIAAFGAAGSFFVQGELYGASARVVVAVVFPRKSPRPGDSTALTQMLEGLRFATRDRRTRMLILVGALRAREAGADHPVAIERMLQQLRGDVVFVRFDAGDGLHLASLAGAWLVRRAAGPDPDFTNVRITAEAG